MRLHFDRVLRFIVVAEELSLTRAATRLNVDQPWLSRQMIQLEEQFGFALFERKAGRIQLTEAGDEFLNYAKEFATATDLLCEKTEALYRRHKFLLRIGAAYFTYWFDARSSLLQHYKALRPEVITELSTVEASEDVVERILKGDLDIGLVIGPTGRDDVEQVRIERGETTVSVPREDPLASAEYVQLSDLRGRCIAVGPNRNPARHAALYGWTEEVGALRVEVPEGRRFMADVAQRDRLLMINLASAERDPDDFVRLAVHGPKPHVDLYMVRKRSIVSAAVERFWQLGQDLANDVRHPELAAAMA